MEKYLSIRLLIALVFLFPLSVIDYRSKIIPNTITIPITLIGVFCSLLIPGWHGLYGALVGVGMFLLPFLLGFMGAGDLKMSMAFGAITGPDAAAAVGFIGPLIGCIVRILLSFIHGNIKEFLLAHLLIFKKNNYVSTTSHNSKEPFAPYYLTGAIAYSFFLWRVLI